MIRNGIRSFIVVKNSLLRFNIVTEIFADFEGDMFKPWNCGFYIRRPKGLNQLKKYNKNK